MRRNLSRNAAQWALTCGLIFLWARTATAQAPAWDLGSAASRTLSRITAGKLKIGGEIRGRYERRTAQGFGAAPDLDTALYRTRVFLTWEPAGWVRFGAALQDSRAPGYGPNASASWRNAADVYETFVELAQTGPRGWSFSLGRRMLTYGNGNLIGTPQWGNVSRAFDHARLSYRSGRTKVDWLFASPVKPKTQSVDRPVLGDHVFGVYLTQRLKADEQAVEMFWLHRNQSRSAGFRPPSSAPAGGKLAINSIGLRDQIVLPGNLKSGTELVVQFGSLASVKHRAFGCVANLGRRWQLGGHSVEASAEYKYASGSPNPAESSRSGTFDPFYPSNHDKFGHMDLFSWRNIHNTRLLLSASVRGGLTLNLMYNSWWLASRFDALYNGAGVPIVVVRGGAPSRHIGQEWDVFGVYSRKPFSLGLGYGRVLAGSFLRTATPGKEPVYVYLSHTYTF